MIKINRPQCPNQAALDNGNYKHPDNKSALIEANHDKCMYCESKVSHVYYGDIEHIRPKAKYPKRAYEWDNLGFACAVCNGKKGDKFDEKTPHINPYDEEPSDHIVAFGAFIWPKQGSERGAISILDIALNRPGLVERRREKIGKINIALIGCYGTINERLKKNALNELIKESDKEKEYSLCVRSFLKVQGIDLA